MAMKFAVPIEYADQVRSGIYAFISMREARASNQECVVFITVLPRENACEYHCEFANPGEADAFAEYMPSFLPAASTGSSHAYRPFC
jgi:hypothetical protein